MRRVGARARSGLHLARQAAAGVRLWLGCSLASVEEGSEALVGDAYREEAGAAAPDWWLRLGCAGCRG
jgi:hypothetical protein